MMGVEAKIFTGEWKGGGCNQQGRKRYHNGMNIQSARGDIAAVGAYCHAKGLKGESQRIRRQC